MSKYNNKYNGKRFSDKDRDETKSFSDSDAKGFSGNNGRNRNSNGNMAVKQVTRKPSTVDPATKLKQSGNPVVNQTLGVTTLVGDDIYVTQSQRQAYGKKSVAKPVTVAGSLFVQNMNLVDQLNNLKLSTVTKVDGKEFLSFGLKETVTNVNFDTVVSYLGIFKNSKGDWVKTVRFETILDTFNEMTDIVKNSYIQDIEFFSLTWSDPKNSLAKIGVTPQLYFWAMYQISMFKFILFTNKWADTSKNFPTLTVKYPELNNIVTTFVGTLRRSAVIGPWERLIQVFGKYVYDKTFYQDVVKPFETPKTKSTSFFDPLYENRIIFDEDFTKGDFKLNINGLDVQLALAFDLEFPTVKDIMQKDEKQARDFANEIISAISNFSKAMNNDYSSMNTFISAIAQESKGIGFVNWGRMGEAFNKPDRTNFYVNRFENSEYEDTTFIKKFLELNTPRQINRADDDTLTARFPIYIDTDSNFVADVEYMKNDVRMENANTGVLPMLQARSPYNSTDITGQYGSYLGSRAFGIIVSVSQLEMYRIATVGTTASLEGGKLVDLVAGMHSADLNVAITFRMFESEVKEILPYFVFTSAKWDWIIINDNMLSVIKGSKSTIADSDLNALAIVMSPFLVSRKS